MLIVATISVLSYINTIPNQFVADDLELIPGNELMHDPLAIKDIATGRYWGELRNSAHYRPFTVWSIAANYRLNQSVGLPGADPAGYHIVNILLHAAASLLMFRFLLDLGVGRWAPLAAATLFASHPIHVDAIAPVTGRAEPLALTRARTPPRPESAFAFDGE